MRDPETDTAPAAARTLDVLETFRAERRPLSLSELARLARIPVSTCHGLVRTLERRGFLYFPTQREVYPTRRLYELAREIDAHDPVVARLAPALGALRDATNETVILGMRHGNAVLYLLVLDSPQIVRYTARTGEHKPLHSSSIGKALLGSLPDEALAAWLDENELPRVTERTITSARRLKRDLEESRARGYYVTRGENVVDVMAIAAPLRLGSAAFGIAIAGPLHRMEDAERKHAARLLQTVRAIEEEARGY
jgi:DNA-binding IclR family transcriptional regulator